MSTLSLLPGKSYTLNPTLSPLAASTTLKRNHADGGGPALSLNYHLYLPAEGGPTQGWKGNS
jgi:hypothetical protein